MLPREQIANHKPIQRASLANQPGKQGYYTNVAQAQRPRERQTTDDDERDTRVASSYPVMQRDYRKAPLSYDYDVTSFGCDEVVISTLGIDALLSRK